MAHPTRFERVTFAFGAGRLRANGRRTDGPPVSLQTRELLACALHTPEQIDGRSIDNVVCIEPCLAARPMQPRPPGIKPGTETLSFDN
jgi:hypothetical protein